MKNLKIFSLLALLAFHSSCLIEEECQHQNVVYLLFDNHSDYKIRVESYYTNVLGNTEKPAYDGKITEDIFCNPNTLGFDASFLQKRYEPDPSSTQYYVGDSTVFFFIKDGVELYSWHHVDASPARFHGTHNFLRPTKHAGVVPKGYNPTCDFIYAYKFTNELIEAHCIEIN